MATVIATSANTPSARRMYYTTRNGGRVNTRTSVVTVATPADLQGLAGFSPNMCTTPATTEAH